MYTSADDEAVIREIQRQCDAVDWTLGKKDHASACYWSSALADSPVIGFKRVSYIEGADLDEVARWHGEGIIDIWAYLSKDTYARGEHLEVRHHSESLYHSVVRTLFDLPFGMAGREYLHHLYKKRVDDRTWVVAYRTPIDQSAFPPPRAGYIRCTIYNSGDRFQLGDDGRIRVEHLMTYTLEGKITPWMADALFRRAHVGAYFKEGKAVKEIFDNTAVGLKGAYPAQFSMYVARERMRTDVLLMGMRAAFDDDRVAWDPIHEGEALTVSTAFVPYCLLRAFRVELICDVDLDRLSALLSDDSMASMPRWDASFVDGEVIRVEGEDDTWRVRSVHGSHAPLDDREFTYVMARQVISEDRHVIAYQSILSYDIPVADNTVRGHLHPSAWRLSRRPDGRTAVEGILIKEYNGRISRKRQNGAAFTKRSGRAVIRNAQSLSRLAA